MPYPYIASPDDAYNPDVWVMATDRNNLLTAPLAQAAFEGRLDKVPQEVLTAIEPDFWLKELRHKNSVLHHVACNRQLYLLPQSVRDAFTLEQWLQPNDAGMTILHMVVREGIVADVPTRIFKSMTDDMWNNYCPVTGIFKLNTPTLMQYAALNDRLKNLLALPIWQGKAKLLKQLYNDIPEDFLFPDSAGHFKKALRRASRDLSKKQKYNL